MGHESKISIFHNLVSEKASSTLTVHTVGSFPATLCSKPRPSLDRAAGICRSTFTAKDPRLSSASRSSKTLGYASSRFHRPPRPHFLGWITVKLERIAISLVYVESFRKGGTIEKMMRFLELETTREA